MKKMYEKKKDLETIFSKINIYYLSNLDLGFKLDNFKFFTIKEKDINILLKLNKSDIPTTMYL